MLVRKVLAVALVSAFTACGDATPPEVDGDYVATITAPTGNADGAAVLELTGAGIEDVSAADAQLFTERSGERVRIVLVRDQPGALRFNVRLARGSAFPTATIIEVADGADALRASTSGYGVRFSR
jgi:hypothetical protein